MGKGKFSTEQMLAQALTLIDVQRYEWPKELLLGKELSLEQKKFLVDEIVEKRKCKFGDEEYLGKSGIVIWLLEQIDQIGIGYQFMLSILKNKKLLAITSYHHLDNLISIIENAKIPEGFKLSAVEMYNGNYAGKEVVSTLMNFLGFKGIICRDSAGLFSQTKKTGQNSHFVFYHGRDGCGWHVMARDKKNAIIRIGLPSKQWPDTRLLIAKDQVTQIPSDLGNIAAAKIYLKKSASKDAAPLPDKEGVSSPKNNSEALHQCRTCAHFKPKAGLVGFCEKQPPIEVYAEGKACKNYAICCPNCHEVITDLIRGCTKCVPDIAKVIIPTIQEVISVQTCPSCQGNVTCSKETGFITKEEPDSTGWALQTVRIPTILQINCFTCAKVAELEIEHRFKNHHDPVINFLVLKGKTIITCAKTLPEALKAARSSLEQKICGLRSKIVARREAIVDQPIQIIKWSNTIIDNAEKDDFGCHRNLADRWI
ncbi:MAG: hypothetical protein M1338_00115 [Patescibacteria group bacterium]|nr:hypothetical protein [Patescibacteria group bacterium]